MVHCSFKLTFIIIPYMPQIPVLNRYTYLDLFPLQGWEESVDAAITHFLRTCLAKSSKDQTVNPQPLTMLKDTTKLKKHIALLCDRLSKGARLVIEGQDNSKHLYISSFLPPLSHYSPCLIKPLHCKIDLFENY